MIKEFHTVNEQGTKEIAKAFAAELKPGDLVCLYGDLGSGKTAFSKSAIEALGVTEMVTSPTFTIVREYEGRIPVYHFDVYRVHSEEDMFEIGYEEYFYGKGVCFIEWAELIEELLPEKVYKIFLQYTDEEDGRMIRIEYPGN
ncbi:MAG: tRNA (adenosine(37)-N6)-threonylcarbamoyltransferase complex ATPase subunit type 1 TsaE [Firmicutes bacterium]|nr:tRNA (adenosine(37)-N6)-threonylcarbamoyltransferase complex ATPase subunit type 1 TsaE [Bacillota bacterium]MBQ4339494.1 tRNA (adenosine(37)-N6)-threonylcarbamoyltransferase complex ATPase subunit type 1 TsaE [Bacillota bacterium]